MNITFSKMHGCGNDFIMIDHRKPFLSEEKLANTVKRMCERKFHIGANGLMLLEESEHADFSMRYFNRDGSVGEMCGNGARCIVKFAHSIGVCKTETTFETAGTLYKGNIDNDGSVTIAFPPVELHTIQTYTVEGRTLYFLWVGVPHVVIFDQQLYNLNDIEFEQFGRSIRQMDQLFPEGANVNIVHPKNNHLHIRTYERGVEEETLACGSGATATAIIAHLFSEQKAPISVYTKGGELKVNFTESATAMTNISLTGEAITVYTGQTTI